MRTVVTKHNVVFVVLIVSEEGETMSEKTVEPNRRITTNIQSTLGERMSNIIGVANEQKMFHLVLFDDGIYFICRENRVSNIQGAECSVKYKDGGRYPARILARNIDRKVLEILKEEAESKDDQSDASTENNNPRYSINTNEKHAVNSDGPPERDGSNKDVVEENSTSQRITSAEISTRRNIKKAEIPEEWNNEKSEGTKNTQFTVCVERLLPTPQATHDVLLDKTVDDIVITDDDDISRKVSVAEQNKVDDFYDLRKKNDVAECANTEYYSMLPAGDRRGPEDWKNEENEQTLTEKNDLPRNLQNTETDERLLPISEPGNDVFLNKTTHEIDENSISSKVSMAKQKEVDDLNDLGKKDEVAKTASTGDYIVPIEKVNDRQEVETDSNVVVMDEMKKETKHPDNPQERDVINEGVIGENSFTQPISTAEISIRRNHKKEVPEEWKIEKNNQTMTEKNDLPRNPRDTKIDERLLSLSDPPDDVLLDKSVHEIDDNSISKKGSVAEQKEVDDSNELRKINGVDKTASTEFYSMSMSTDRNERYGTVFTETLAPNDSDCTIHASKLNELHNNATPININSANLRMFDEKKKPAIRSIEIVKACDKYDVAKIVPFRVRKKLPDVSALDKTYTIQSTNLESESGLARSPAKTDISSTLHFRNCQTVKRDFSVENSRNASRGTSSFNASFASNESSDPPTLDPIFTNSVMDQLLDEIIPEKQYEEFSTTYPLPSNSVATGAQITGLQDTTIIISNGFDNAMTVAAEISVDASINNTELLEAFKQPVVFSTPNDTGEIENNVDNLVSGNDLANATFIAGDPTTKPVVQANALTEYTEIVDQINADTPQYSGQSSRASSSSVESEDGSHYEPSASDSSSHDNSADEEEKSFNRTRSLSRRSNQNSSLEISLSANVPGKSTRDDGEMFITTASGKKGFDRRSYCMYCRKMQTKFARHLETKHKDVPEVQKFAKLPKGNAERLKIIDTIRKNCMFEFNTNSAVNDGELMVCRRPSANAHRPATHYKTCQNCKGFFSKSNLRHHAKKCFGYNGKKGRTLLVLGRKILGRIHAEASDILRKEVFPVLREDEVVRQIRYDRLVILYGNKLCAKYGSLQHQHDMIRAQLRLLGRFLCALKAINDNVEEFASVYQPKIYDDAILAINEVAGFDEKTKTYRSPSTAYSMGALLKKIANLYIFDCIKREDVEQKAKTEDFLKLLTEDIAISVNKNVMETQTLQKRRKKVELPSDKDIQTLHNYLKDKRTSAYRALEKGFESSEWLKLAQSTMTSVQLFNRRRAGEIERILIEDFQNWEGINREELKKMSKESQEIAKNYVRFTIRGKLGRTVAVLLTTDLLRCMEKILQYRNDVKVPSTNRYVFGICGADKTRNWYLRACILMRKFANESGIEFPHKMRGTTLRKHIATSCIQLNLSENEVADVANFMGHAEKIHRDHYRQPILSREIMRMSKILEKVQGGNEDDDDDDCEDDENEQEESERSSRSEDEAPALVEKTKKVKNTNQRCKKQSGILITTQRAKDSKSSTRKRTHSQMTVKTPARPSSKDDGNYSDDSENDENFRKPTAPSRKKQKKRSTSPYGPIGTKQRWTAEDKEIIMRVYASHFRLRTFPSLKQITQDCSKYPSLAARGAAVIKSWMSNQYKKMKK